MNDSRRDEPLNLKQRITSMTLTCNYRFDIRGAKMTRKLVGNTMRHWIYLPILMSMSGMFIKYVLDVVQFTFVKCISNFISVWESKCKTDVILLVMCILLNYCFCGDKFTCHIHGHIKKLWEKFCRDNWFMDQKL